MDDLLRSSSPFEDKAPQDTSNNPLDGLEIHSRPSSENGDEEEQGTDPLSNTTAENNVDENGRRRRSESEPDPEEEARISQRSFMESVMDKLNIKGPACEQGRDFADLTLEQQVMQWYCLQLSQDSRIDNLAASNFIRSEVFEVYQTHVLFRCRAALLAPWLSNYVTILQEWLLSDMLQHPEAWRMEADVTEVAEQWQQFSSEIKVRVTQIRSQNKTAMYRLRTQEADINIIAKKLAPKGMVIREHHRARLAWIMLLTTECDEKVQKGEQKTSNFWDWIGQQVLLLRTRIATDPKYQTDQARRQEFTQVFTRALARHRTKFPPSSAPPPAKPRPAWQETLEDAMKLGSVI
ncbi:unnamed protein product [Rhizoctonia solani]|uniref:Uncharacterized protein n=1 Tax=Rhizoctonia solani TaxID=456999 RepID=A0A8H3A432_9AGAM|nr:unnamed protein product [Rhizoctonia solani]